MSPALDPGDRIIMEDMTYLSRAPHRGDIIIFKTDGIGSLTPGGFFVKRLVGEPGDHVQISGGELFINEEPISISNAFGKIVYDPPQAVTMPLQTNVTVPSGCYFVIGDNSTNSADSRLWGCVPRKNIIGRVGFRYWPPKRAGGVE